MDPSQFRASRAVLRSLPSAFVEEAVDSVGSKSMDRVLDDGLATIEIIGDLLGSCAFHVQFDDEHAFALPAGRFTFEAGEKPGSDS